MNCNIQFFLEKIDKTLVKWCGEPINCIAIFLTLQDFRNFTYSLPIIRGMMIHMEDKLTTVLIPQNSYPQIQKALEMSNTPVLALGGNFRLVFWFDDLQIFIPNCYFLFLEILVCFFNWGGMKPRRSPNKGVRPNPYSW